MAKAKKIAPKNSAAKTKAKTSVKKPSTKKVSSSKLMQKKPLNMMSAMTASKKPKMDDAVIDEIFKAIQVAFEMIESAGGSKAKSSKTVNSDMNKMMKTINECMTLCDKSESKAKKSAPKKVQKSSSMVKKSSVVKKSKKK